MVSFRSFIAKNVLASNPDTFIWQSPPTPGCHGAQSTVVAGQFPLILFQLSFFALNFVNNKIFESVWFSTDLYLLLNLADARPELSNLTCPIRICLYNRTGPNGTVEQPNKKSGINC